MSVSRVQVAYAHDTTAGTAVPTLASTPTVGNTLVAIATANGNDYLSTAGDAIPLAPPAGWSTAQFLRNGNYNISVFYKTVASGDGTAYTFTSLGDYTGTGNSTGVEITEVAGLTGAVDQAVSASTTTFGTTLATPNTGTTSTAAEYVAMGTNSDTGVAISWSSVGPDSFPITAVRYGSKTSGGYGTAYGLTSAVGQFAAQESGQSGELIILVTFPASAIGTAATATGSLSLSGTATAQTPSAVSGSLSLSGIATAAGAFTCTAVVVGSDVDLSWPAAGASYAIERDGALIQFGYVGTSYTDVAPGAGAHSYRVGVLA